VGPVYTYYEFTHPMNDRMTDEQWIEHLSRGDVPARPQWAREYLEKCTADGGTFENRLTNGGTPWDTNGDGSVDVLDLVLAGRHFGEAPPKDQRADVNEDGIVNIFDLVLIGQHFGESYILTAPDVWTQDHSQYLSELKSLYALIDENSHPNAVELKLLLRKLIALAERRIPSKTSLGQNYPNPFNPDTWIPYNLAYDASITITIYNAKGQRIRSLSLGTQLAGEYLTKDKAVSWDGRNEYGEQVGSGTYFYQLQVGDFSAIKKMILLK